MIEFNPDLLLAAKTVKSRRVTFNLQIGNFQSHRLAGLPVVGFEQRSHAALGDDIGDFKPLIEQMPHADVIAERTAGFDGGGLGLQ